MSIVNPKVMMLIASVIGAWTGILVIMVGKPGYDYFVWLGLFVIIGVGFGNLALLVLFKMYEWFKKDE